MMLLPILGGLYLGRWLDDKFKTESIFLFIFIILGIISSFANLFRVAMKNVSKKGRD
ncbi:F0F1-type ATP synthase assembly protein I [Alkaliphilus hydrothermalis]|uniref:F0F1-type ATP synthase assembly protein I n=2 Tax=Alkaliphilus hydrothermalis TaxID=1482730 RepID=A0ABS2NQQ2_9FIRM|nr:F0F1-type ATP synthase assembly protein I [Alkaliphilus hydrothermalis]